MNWRLRLYRNESFFSGLQMLRWSTSTSIRSPMPRSLTRTGQRNKITDIQYRYALFACAFIFILHTADKHVLFSMCTSVTYLLIVSVPPVSWSWDQYLLAVSLQSLAPWIPFLWPCPGSSHSGCAVLVSLKTQVQQLTLGIKQFSSNKKEFWTSGLILFTDLYKVLWPL